MRRRVLPGRGGHPPSSWTILTMKSSTRLLLRRSGESERGPLAGCQVRTLPADVVGTARSAANARRRTGKWPDSTDCITLIAFVGKNPRAASTARGRANSAATTTGTKRRARPSKRSHRLRREDLRSRREQAGKAGLSLPSSGLRTPRRGRRTCWRVSSSLSGGRRSPLGTWSTHWILVSQEVRMRSRRSRVPWGLRRRLRSWRS